MNTILDYKQTTHFIERLSQRQIDPFLVSMCLIKGSIKRMQKNKVEFTLTKDSILQSIEQGYMSNKDCIGLTSLTVVTRKKILITAFVKFGDTGITD